MNGANRVVILTDDLGGGTGNHLLAMMKHWDRDQWNPEIFSRASVTSRVEHDVSIRSIPSYAGIHRYPIAQVRSFRSVREAVSGESPRILHAYFFWPILFGRILKRMGVVRTLVENREDQGFDWGFHEYSLLRWTKSLPDRIVCVSEAVKRVVAARERIGEDRITVVRNGIGSLLPVGENPREIRKEFGFDPGHLVVGMVANFNRAVKGVSLFLDAIPQIVRAVPSARFLIVGRGKEEGALREKAKTMGIERYAVFAGYRPDIHRCYAVMDVSALTSFSEGLSITLLESMQCGIPVVATRVGGNPEVVADGSTGYLVPPRDVPAFVERTVRLLQDPEKRKRMGEEARLRVDRHFRIQDTAARYLEIYGEVLRGNGGMGKS